MVALLSFLNQIHTCIWLGWQREESEACGNLRLSLLKLRLTTKLCPWRVNDVSTFSSVSYPVKKTLSCTLHTYHTQTQSSFSCVQCKHITNIPPALCTSAAKIKSIYRTICCTLYAAEFHGEGQLGKKLRDKYTVNCY